MAYANVHLPKGYEVAIKTEDDNDFVDLGVMNADGSIEFTYERSKVTGSKGEVLIDRIYNMIVNATFSMFQLNMANISKLMGGATAYTTVAGTPVSGAEQVVASGGWAYNKFIPIENQNGDGSAITVNSVTGGTDGALVEDTDFYVGQDANGKYGIFVLDSATVTTTSQTLTIDYDYTPNASEKITAGSTTVDITPYAVRMRKNLGTQAAPKYWTATIYSATNTAGFNFSFPRSDTEEPTTLEVTLEGNVDEDRSDFDKLFSIEAETV